MVTWIGFVGKLVEYLAKRLLDKTIDPTLIDARKKACKAFLDFYDSIFRLEFLCEDILDFLESLASNKNIKIDDKWLKNISEQIDSASNDFIEKLKDLSFVIHFYDKDLGKLFSKIKRGKKGFLETASTFPQKIIFNLNYEESNDSQPFFECSIPSDEAIAIDLDQYYNSLKSERLSDIEWPDDVLLSIVENRTSEKQVHLFNQEEVQYLIDIIQNHLSFLITAKEKLNEFIRIEFTIEDLLYFTKRYTKNN